MISEMISLGPFWHESISSFPLASQKQAYPSLTAVETPESESSLSSPGGPGALRLPLAVEAAWTLACIFSLSLWPRVDGELSTTWDPFCPGWLYILPQSNREKRFPCAHRCCEIMLPSTAGLALSGTKEVFPHVKSIILVPSLTPPPLPPHLSASVPVHVS